MFVLREALLLCSIFFCLSSAKAPKEGQKCTAEGQTGKCYVWHKCAPIAEILQRNPPRESELVYAEKFICGYKKHTPYYCCIDGMSGQPEPSRPEPPRPEPPRPPPNPDTPTSSEEEKNIQQKPLLNHRNRTLIPMETCGQTENKYIVGGEQATLGEYPWLALIHYKHNRRNGQFMCGGALINKHYVLTAAHCLHPVKLFGYSPDMVRLGEYNLATDPDAEHGREGRLIEADPVIDFMIEETVMHEDYHPVNNHQFHDIGLIRLKGEAPETRYVKPICLPTPEVDSEIVASDDYLQVAGWGNTEYGSRSSVLLKIAIPTEDFKTCAQKYSYLGRNVSTSQLCAGMQGKDSCQGDSGGPLMGVGRYSDYRNTRFFAVGLVSYGHVECGLHDIPGVYTRVMPYVSWILDHMKP